MLSRGDTVDRAHIAEEKKSRDSCCNLLLGCDAISSAPRQARVLKGAASGVDRPLTVTSGARHPRVHLQPPLMRMPLSVVSPMLLGTVLLCLRT